MATRSWLAVSWPSRLRIMLAVGSLCAGLGAGQLALSAPRAHAAGNAILWGAYVNGAPWDAAKLDGFEQNAGRKQAIIHWGQPWFHGGRYQPFQTQYFQ